MISWYAVVIWSSLALVLGIPIIQSIKHNREKRKMKHMEDMRCDMAGAATVLYTVKSASQLKLNKRVIAIVPTCENLLGSKAYKQGDVLTAYNGKTIEIWHTDAEGRLILADAMSYI